LRSKWAAGKARGGRISKSVTDEQRGRRPIFNATFRAAASWLFFRVARSAVMIQIARFARALKNSQLTCGEAQGI
jgi:hypothetical protein